VDGADPAAARRGRGPPAAGRGFSTTARALRAVLVLTFLTPALFALLTLGPLPFLLGDLGDRVVQAAGAGLQLRLVVPLPRILHHRSSSAGCSGSHVPDARALRAPHARPAPVPPGRARRSRRPGCCCGSPAPPRRPRTRTSSPRDRRAAPAAGCRGHRGPAWPEWHPPRRPRCAGPLPRPCP